MYGSNVDASCHKEWRYESVYWVALYGSLYWCSFCCWIVPGTVIND